MPNALDTYISHIRDQKLRAAIAGEVVKLRQNKQYGLVFDEHLPETILLHKRRPRVRDTVIREADEKQVIYVVTKVVNTKRVRIRPEVGGDESDARIGDLTVVKRFGEPIYPALVPVHRIRRSDDPRRPWHTIINADNYHALQLLLYTCEGQVDVIYIDPPYNSGARDWKYNNNYVDRNDRWRHSKWLSMMKRRLVLAKRLLKRDGVLILTIDENEVYNLGVMLGELFPEYLRQMLTIVINPKGTGKLNFARVEEHAMFCIPDLGESVICGIPIWSV